MPENKIPVEFMEFTAFFHQDIDVIFPDGEGMVEDAINNTPPEDRVIIKKYLEELLSDKYDEASRRLIWRSTRADVSPFRGNEGNCTAFLEYIISFFAEEK